MIQQLYTALQVNESLKVTAVVLSHHLTLKVSSCSFQITNTSMQASCTSTVWGANVQAAWVIYSVPGALAMSGTAGK